MQSRWIWPFELQEKLGEGGMGIVYKARYVGNDRIVALKLLPPSLGDNPTAVARFEREMEVLKKLRHPHIVHCFGGTCESKQRFYAMELVQGGNLEERLKQKGRLDWVEVVEYAEQMVAALSYAHERQVIHRDIKPANFLITREGKLKLSDFGLASITSVDRLTATGKTMGTFHYMSPEQIRGKPPLTGRSDLYAVGCVLFELLTGRPPFEGDSPAAVLHKHLKESPPRVSEVVLDCPVQLDRLISDLLAKDPNDRPQSAAEVAERLKDVSHTTRAQIPITPSPFASLTQRKPASTAGDSDLSRRTTTAMPLWPAFVIPLLLGVICLVFGALLTARDRAERAEALWLNALNSTNAEVRRAAAESLGQLAGHSPVAMEAAIAALDDPDAGVQAAAARGLGEAGRAARKASGKLINLRKTHEWPEVRNAADAALKAIDQAPSGTGWLAWTGWLLLTASVVVGGFLGIRKVMQG